MVFQGRAAPDRDSIERALLSTQRKVPRAMKHNVVGTCLSMKLHIADIEIALWFDLGTGDKVNLKLPILAISCVVLVSWGLGKNVSQQPVLRSIRIIAN